MEKYLLGTYIFNRRVYLYSSKPKLKFGRTIIMLKALESEKVQKQLHHSPKGVYILDILEHVNKEV